MTKKAKIFLLSRTDSIGDVVLSLPVAGMLKKMYPLCKIYFLGQKYTQSVIESCAYVDTFLNWTELKELSPKAQIDFLKQLKIDEIIHIFPKKEIAKLAKLADISLRTGTRNRWFHWLYCNNLMKLSRKKSSLHESQLNLKLIKNLESTPSISHLPAYYGFSAKGLPDSLKAFIETEKKNIILHPKSKGSAREWGLDNYASLIELLPQEKFNILLTGTEEEGQLFREKLVHPYPFVKDLSGKISLTELISVIGAADALVACSTGPLHIAAALGKLAIGIYPPIKPMHPGRWAPVGENAKVLVTEKNCKKCKKTMNCECIHSIKATDVSILLAELK